MKLISTIFGSSLLFGAVAMADVNLLPRTMWSAFQCSYFAASYDDEEGTERLFLVGFESGKQLFEAIEEGLVDAERLSAETPIGVSMVWQGPSEDFVIGRVFESATRDAVDILTGETPGDAWDDGLRTLAAKRLFQDRNCMLLETRE